MNKFLLTQITVEPQTNLNVSGKYVVVGAPDEIITMELKAISIEDETVRKLQNIVEAGRYISINDSDYMDWTEPFKAEFKEFLLEKYPERIMKDQKGFERLFGMKDETSSSR